ncbi:MAG: histidine phosphotransferase [Rhizobiaceae bacterium]|nr:histidine phosphotransferase family protein [Hyphomicrobiales bacterium]NRB30583.1 histidine phosphotransferase [Rhizobiaceae bacterium]
MPNLPTLSSLDLAALLASRVCHDIISPVGALANGLEVLEEDQGEEMREFAMELITKSAKSASAKLKFSRLAFGASGSAGAAIDTGEAEEVVGLFMEGEKADYTWQGTRSLVPKNRVKLLLNLVLISLGAIPRGGTVAVTIDGEGETATFSLRCTGPKARVPGEFVDMLNGTLEGDMTAHAIQPYYAILLAQETGLTLSAKVDGEDIVLSAS